MDSFTPLTIEDFDRKFVNKDAQTPVSAPAYQESHTSLERTSLIPDIAVEQAVPAAQKESYFAKKPQDNSAVLPFPVEELPNDNAPAYSNVKPFPATKRSPVQERGISFDDYPEEPEQKSDAPRSAGNLAAKIAIIVLLAATLTSFVLGCFVSMFLDNSANDIAGYTFCTMKADVLQPKLSEGDMIIVKKSVPSDYVTGKLIAFKSSVANEGCRVHVVSSATQLVYADEYAIITTGYDGDTAATATITSNDVIGIVTAYVPNVGGMLSFAMNNAILVCALYVLLVVFWGLLLVLVERTKHQK